MQTGSSPSQTRMAPSCGTSSNPQARTHWALSARASLMREPRVRVRPRPPPHGGRGRTRTRGSLMSEARADNAQWVRACGLDEVPQEGAIRVWLGDEPVCIARSNDDVHAIYDVCSHAEVALSEG